MMTEEQITSLVLQAQAGDKQAFGELVEQFEPTVFAITLRKLRNRAEAHEVTQDVLIQAFRKLPQLREADRFAGWLRQIANRMAINRAVRKPHEALRTPETFDVVQSEPDTPLDAVLRNERRAQVLDGLHRLRALDRETLIAFYFEGRSLQEMSDSFDSPVGTIKRRLHTARGRLREALSVLNPA